MTPKPAQSRCQLARTYSHFTQPHLALESASHKLSSREKSSATGKRGFDCQQAVLLVQGSITNASRLKNGDDLRFATKKKSCAIHSPQIHFLPRFGYRTAAAAATALCSWLAPNADTSVGRESSISKVRGMGRERESRQRASG